MDNKFMNKQISDLSRIMSDYGEEVNENSKKNLDDDYELNY